MSTYLFVQVTYPLSKLLGVGDGGRQEDIVHVVREKDDGLLPHHTTLYREEAAATVRGLSYSYM